ncbi:MAG: hypothetical protein M3498_18410 [Deinococcota bacterium]|nr:hypothetical protein [Deinococcota bacterium]
MNRFTNRVTRGMVIALLALLALPFAGAQHDHGAQSNEVTLTVTEEGFEAPDTLDEGYIVFTLQNETGLTYAITIGRLQEGVSAEDVAAAGTAIDQAFVEGGDFVAAFRNLVTIVELLSSVDADGDSIGVVLRPGRYILYGELRGGPEGEGPAEEGAEAGEDQAEDVEEDAESAEAETAEGDATAPEGATAPTILEFEVIASTDAPSAPEADVQVDMVNFAFAMPAQIQSGPLLWEVRNPSDQAHHLIIMRLHEGATVQDVLAFMETFEGEPPADEVDYVDMISPDGTVYATLDLEPGDYLALCFIPDHGEEGSGEPHIALGMHQAFTVTGN